VGSAAAGELSAEPACAGVWALAAATVTGVGPGNDAATRWKSSIPGTMKTAIATGATTLRDTPRRVPDLVPREVPPFSERLAASVRYVPSAVAVLEIRIPRLTGGLANGMAVTISGPKSRSPRR
jgi:hypothetical protein